MKNSECVIGQYRGGRRVRSFIPSGDPVRPWRMEVDGRSYLRTSGWVLSKILPTLEEGSPCTTRAVPGRGAAANRRKKAAPPPDLSRSSHYHRVLALLAAREAQRVLPLFERAYPADRRPRRAIAAIVAWAHDRRKLSMAAVRELSLGAHAAARKAKCESACFAARAAGHAVATWHCPTHAMGAPIYAAKAMLASGARPKKTRAAAGSGKRAVRRD